MGEVYSINISDKKGVAKKNVKKAVLIEGLGLKDDAHAAVGDRQVSLLAIESIRKQKECVKIKTSAVDLKPGDFAENITTQGINLVTLKIGAKLRIGNNIILKISKIGKECHRFCSIYYKTGDCIMPREGIFAEVVVGGEINCGDIIEVDNEIQ